MIKCIGFDLDGTLYDEDEYISAAYQEIANNFSNASEIYDYLWDTRRKNGDDSIFQRLINHFNLSENSLEALISIYQNVSKEIDLFPDVHEFLAAEKKINYCILTNGSALTQKNKIRNLGISSYFDKVFITGELLERNEWKPNPVAYKLIGKAFNVEPNEIIFVGNSIKNDISGALNSGLQACLIDRKSSFQISFDNGFWKCSSFSYLNEIINLINNGINSI